MPGENVSREEPTQAEEPPPSRIPTYDPFRRFRDSSRPPDSHYPRGPNPNARSCHFTREKVIVTIWFLVILIAFLIFIYS